MANRTSFVSAFDALILGSQAINRKYYVQQIVCKRDSYESVKKIQRKGLSLRPHTIKGRLELPASLN
eukprot:6200148-Pleurochrysis_carterae.AAC.1